MNLRKMGLVGSIFIALYFFAFSAYARLPEPDNIIYGVARENSATVTAELNGAEIATFVVAVNPDLAPYYTLRLPIDSLEPRLTGTARPGDEIEIFVDGESLAAATLTVGEMGTIVKLHLATVDSDEDGMLDAWELAYFLNLGVSDGSGDLDQDGLTDLEEFQRDTSPTVKTDIPPEPEIAVDQTSVDFGSVDINGNSNTKTLIVSNNGTSDLLIGTLILEGADAADFRLSIDNCSGQTIPPAQNRTVQITFDPSLSGKAVAQLTIPSNDPGTPLRVELSGTGTDDGILYVNDDSYCNGESSCYSSIGGLGGAYAAAGEGSEIRISSEGTYLEGDLDFNQDVAIFLRGGWDEDYSENSGEVTAISGSLIISAGTVIIEGVVLEGNRALVRLDSSAFDGWLSAFRYE